MTTDSEIPEGCLPFDLEKARAGHPCRTRSGMAIYYVGEMTKSRTDCPVIWDTGVNRTIETSEEGSYLSCGNEDSWDIFLTAPRKAKRTAWANMFNAPGGGISFPQSYVEGKLFKTEAEARRHNVGGEFRTTCKIEWEEIENDNK